VVDCDWTDGLIHLRALRSNADGTWTDVSEEVQWDTTNPEFAVFVGPGTLLQLTEDDVYFSASLPDAASRLYLLGDPRGNIREGGGDPDDGEPVSEKDLRTSIHLLMDELTRLGWDPSSLRKGLDQISLNDNNSLINLFGRSWLTEDQKAVTTMPALWAFNGNGPGRVLISTNINVTLRHSLCVELVEGKFLVDSKPYMGLTKAAQAIVHELLHVMLDEAGIEFPATDTTSSVDREEAYVDGFTDVLGLITQILGTASDQTLTEADRLRLIKGQLTMLRARLQALRESYPEIYEQVLKLLGLQDENNNGIPDILEELLRQLGIPVPQPLPGTHPTPNVFIPNLSQNGSAAHFIR
jgi:hypothetical protein